MRHARCRSFDFNPVDFLNDPNVLVMSFEERGAYISLLCRAWDLSIPGVLPADEGVIRRLIGATPEEWDRVRSALRKCFDTSDGRWTQLRMTREYESQTTRVTTAAERHRRISQRGGQARSSRSSRDQSGKFVSNNDIAPASPAGVQPFLSSSLLPPLLLTPKESEPNPLSKPTARTVEVDGFAEWYKGYPVHVARGAAARAYRAALKKANPPTLASGRDRYVAHLATVDTKPKHPATWLNAECWLDETSTEAVAAPSTQQQVQKRILELEAERGLDSV